MSAYAEALLAVIAAPDGPAKAGLLAALAPPPPGATWIPPAPPARPGRPAHYRDEAAARPRRRRTLRHGPTRQRFLLSIHHIELSAIDLAVLACLMGPDMPPDFHRDQLAVAAEEAVHAGLLADLLTARGWPPGCEPVHHRLWDAALAADDLGELLVVVPRFLEARGLDVSADLLPRLEPLDPEAHAVIARIYADEIGHVATGTRWHHAWCAAHALDPEAHFATVVHKHFGAQLPNPWPLDRPARLHAGFTPADLLVLTTPITPRPGSAPTP